MDPSRSHRPVASRRVLVAVFASVAAMTCLAAEPDCTPQKQIDVAKIGRRIVLVGEVHGTAEIPRFVLGLACSLVRAQRPVILVVEHQGEQQEALNRYLVSEGSRADRDRLLEGVNWRGYSDGRGSVAMFGLVEGMRRLRHQGQRVAVLAMNGNGNLDVPLLDDEKGHVSPAQNALLNRVGNQSMADSILSAAVLNGRFTLVVLAGYSHTSTLRSTGNSAMFGDYDPMGRLVAAQVPVFTIGLESEGGDHWATGREGSKAYALPAGTLFVDGSPVDARVNLGRLTSSPPARSVAND